MIILILLIINIILFLHLLLLLLLNLLLLLLLLFIPLQKLSQRLLYTSAHKIAAPIALLAHTESILSRKETTLIRLIIICAQ